MTSPVMAALANAKAAEQAAEERTLTNAVRKHLAMAPPHGDVTQWPVWQQWCAKSNVAAFPALPAAISIFVLNCGLPGDRVEKILGSIGAVHESEGKADPTLSPVVIAAVNQVLPPIEPPKWPRERKADFGRLNRELQKFIVAHERQIVTEMRRAQNEAARAKRKDDGHHGNTGKEQPTAAARADRIDAGAD